MRPTRSWRVIAGASALALLVAGGCSGGGDTEAAPPGAVEGRTEVTPGAVTVSSAGPQVGVDDAVRDQMVETVRKYVQAATVDPLRTGRAAATELAALFTTPAAARAEGVDRAVLVDAGLPKATADLTAIAAPVAITALVDRDGNLVLASAGLDLTVSTKTRRGPVGIHRVGSLTLAPDAGAWKIAGFDLSVTRAGKGVDARTAPTGATGSTEP